MVEQIAFGSGIKPLQHVFGSFSLIFFKYYMGYFFVIHYILFYFQMLGAIIHKVPKARFKCVIPAFYFTVL